MTPVSLNDTLRQVYDTNHDFQIKQVFLLHLHIEIIEQQHFGFLKQMNTIATKIIIVKTILEKIIILF